MMFARIPILLFVFFSLPLSAADDCLDIFSSAENGNTSFALTPLVSSGTHDIDENNNYTLTLAAGQNHDYDSIKANNDFTLNVTGSGTARLHLNGSLELKNGARINAGGNPEDLVIYINGNIVINNNAVINALIWTNGNIEINNNGTTTGALSANGNIILGSHSTSYDLDAISVADFSGMCNAPIVTIDHFEITHDGQGLTCEAENITIKACADAACTTLSTNITDVQLSINGTLNKTVTVSGGSTDTNFSYTDVSTATLSLDQTYECANGGSTSCDVVFADAGFRFLYGTAEATSIDNQTSGDDFAGIVTLQAVKDVDGVCTGLFTGDKEVELSQQNIAPDGITGLSFNVNGNSIAKYPTYTSDMTLNFGDDSKATILTPVYLDAGQIRLHAKYDVDDVSLVGSSNDFWVSPAKLIATVKSEGADINGNTDSSDTIHKAGQVFDFTVTAYNSIGITAANVTANYIPNDIQLLLTRTGPTAGGVEGVLNYGNGTIPSALAINAIYQSVNLTTFSSGISSTSNTSYSEVGLLNLDLQDIDYAYSGNIILGGSIVGDTIDIGRFIPDHFDQTVPSNGHGSLVVNHGNLGDVCYLNTTFAYTGQVLLSDAAKGAISYFVNPVVELTAKNVQGATTKNYTEANYMKLNAAANFIVAPTADSTITGKDANLLPLMADMYAGTVSHNGLVAGEPEFDISLADGVLHYELADDDNFVYSRNENSEVNAQENDIYFIIDQDNFVDSDGVGIADPENITETTGINLRFGRAYLENSFGPETSNLPQPFLIQYLNASGSYVINDQDSCTNFDASEFTLTSGTLDETETGVNAVTGQLESGETRLMLLTAPGAGNQGTINVEYDIYDWLKYDWDWNGVDAKEFNQDPSAIATFGIFRGNDRIIYQREVH